MTDLPVLKFWVAFIALVLGAQFSAASWKEHYRYQKDPSRHRRQLFSGQPQAIDLNITVPFIFSARLYPYGESQGDKLFAASNPSTYAESLVLRNELTYLGDKYNAIYITQDGAIGFTSDLQTVSEERFPRGPRIIAPFWTPVSLGDVGRVYFRESTDKNVLSLAGSEIQIQYQVVEGFRPESVVVVTWENVAPPNSANDLPVNSRNTFQAALILSNNGSFVHFIYSKLRWHNSAMAGFNDGEGNSYYELPGSGTPRVLKLANNSDIGIPGEWLFKVDGPQVYLCGPGYKGIECVDKCTPGEYYYDCGRRCHCANSGVCNPSNGQCPGATPQCARGWTHPPTCDIDDDECEHQGDQLCASDAPDCINTPGSYICTCLTGFDNTTGACNGHAASPNNHQLGGAAIEVVPHQPNVVLITPSGGVRNLPTRPPGISVTVNGPIEIVPQQPNVIFPIAVIPGHPSATSTRAEPVPTQRFFGTSTQPEVFETDPPTSTVEPTTEAPTTTTTTTTTTTQPVTERLNPLATRPPVTCNASCGANAHCDFIQGAPSCICNAGWSGDGVFCVDVNECFLGSACEGNARCQNTLGSYSCLCEQGFQAEGTQCVDVDECESGLVQCPGGNTSQCVNTHGGYECRCKPGYNGNPASILGCIDINECLIPRFYCGPDADCENTLGAFKCKCHRGYETNTDDTGCIDIDECARNPCDKAAACYNQPGSFGCQCFDGYSGNGINCTETILYPFDRAEDQRLPQHQNSVNEVPLERPITLFGKQYDRIFVSSNGIITVQQPLNQFEPLLLPDIGLVGVAPLYFEANMSRGGAVYIRQTTGRGALPLLTCLSCGVSMMQCLERASVTRGSLNVQQDFNEPHFQADNVVVVTFEDIPSAAETDDAKRSTFQAVFASSTQGTYVTYIYDKINAVNAQAGVLSTDALQTLVMPGSGTDVRPLRQSSNVGRHGKWIFRLDLSHVIGCPAGYTGPPYCVTACPLGTWGQNCTMDCQCASGEVCNAINGSCPSGHCMPGFTGENCHRDIDECVTGLSRCHPRAVCTNHPGSYACQCREGWTGDGVTCAELSPCYVLVNIVCHDNAYCATPDGQNGTPVCVCRPGFEGDGLSCIEANTTVAAPSVVTTATSSSVTAQTTTTTSTSRWNITDLFEERNLTHPSSTTILGGSSSSSSALPASPRTTKTTQAPTHPLPTTTQSPATSQAKSTNTQKQPQPEQHITYEERTIPPVLPKKTTVAPTIQLENPENALDTVLNGHSQNSVAADGNSRLVTADTSSPSNLLVIVIPAVLCGIWLILIVVLVIVCLRRRKQRQRERYGLGYYVPQSHAGSVKTSTTNGNGASMSAYGSASQWSIPRPHYEYYQDITSTEPDDVITSS